MSTPTSSSFHSRRDFLARAAALGATALVIRSARAESGLDTGRTSTLPDAADGRIHVNFDRGWRFAHGAHSGADGREFDDSTWRRLDLPHDWSIEGPLDPEAATGGLGGYVPAGVGWYRKRFRVPAAHKGRRVTIRFDGVYMDSTVWVNGRKIGRWPFGYSSFNYDLTPHLVYGDETNVIAVHVDNSRQPGSRWYSGSGIYRHVWITVTDPIHVVPWGVWVTTSGITPGSAQVRVRTRLINDLVAPADVDLLTEILDPQGEVVAKGSLRRTLAAGELHECDQTMWALAAPRRWSPETPDLYQVRTSVMRNGTCADGCLTTFGIREIEYHVDRGLQLNGAPVKMLGMCLHHDGGAVGAAVPEDVLERRLRLLREMGCNAIRTSHNPMAPEFYDLCDRLGFLVMNEAFDEWVIRKPRIEFGYSDFFREWWERDLVNFIHRDRNHPCVVMWSAGNEIHEQSADFGSEVLRPLVEVFHREDPTRPVTAGLDRVYTNDPVRPSAPTEFVALLDIAGYNYCDRYDTRRETLFADDRAAFPQRRFVGTEDDNLGDARGEYRFRPVGPGLPEVADYVSNASGLIHTSRMWRFALTHEYDIGHFMWTGIDYLGETSWPRRLASTGVLDTCGFRKDTFYFYQSLFRRQPVLHLAPHWNWSGREQKIVPVLAFTNCEVVELFLNGRSLGAKVREFPRLGRDSDGRRRVPPATTADLHLVWDVPYEPGVLRAVGYADGREVATREVRTAGSAAALDLVVDRAVLTAGRRGIAHMEVHIVDSSGVLVPDASHEVTFEVVGSGKLRGVDSGDPQSHESYQAPRRRAFRGMCLGLVEAGDQPGVIDVAAHAPGLKSALFRIEVAAEDRPVPAVKGAM